MSKKMAAILGLLVFSTSACAEDCKAVQDAATRLACFDKAAKTAPKAIKKPTPVDEFAAAKTAMRQKLNDPDSARFDDLFKVTTDTGEAVCGLVNSKNRMGGYVGNTGFIFEKSLNRATLLFSGANDPDYSAAAAAAYCVYCMPAGRGDRNILDHCPDLIRAYRH